MRSLHLSLPSIPRAAAAALASYALVSAAGAQIVWTGASGIGIFRDSNWDFSASTVAMVDPGVPIADDVRFIGPGVNPRIPELSGQDAFTMADGFNVLIDGLRVYAVGNDGVSGEVGGIQGTEVRVVNGGSLEVYFITNRTHVVVDGSSQLILGGPATPVNGSTIDLTLGARLEFLLETPDDFRSEHLSKVTVDGVAATEGFNLRIDPVGSQGAVVTVLPSDVGVNYCQANATSTGAPARMSAFGSGSVSANQLELTALDMPTLVFGFFITSPTDGFTMNPGGSSGNLCVSGSVGRYVAPGQIQNSGNGGTISIPADLTALPQPNGPATGVAGETWYFQCWFRDAGVGAPTSNFTDGLAVLLR